jgi:dihydrofolate synthase/folylpolyglutamate synthase
MTESLQDWLTRLDSMHPKSIDLGLDRCRQVYRRMGTPRPARQVWTVAGTNGKGSVVAFLDSLLRAGGLSSGSFTSPHILSFNERISIGGDLAPDEVIIDAFERVEQARQGVSLTYFEFTTLAALLMLHDADLDAAILEVGLGGRLDAVNLVDADCAVITTIGIDHEEYLGSGRESIGREKAGIMRPGRPVVLGEANPPHSVLEHAERTGVKPILSGRDFSVTADAAGCHVTIGSRRLWLGHPPLGGRHQLSNMATALAALAQLQPQLLEDSRALERGVGRVQLAGRLQHWPADRRVLLDVAHNAQAAETVAAYLAGIPDLRCLCVLAMLADKNAEGLVRPLDPLVGGWFCAGLGGARGQSAEALARRVSGVVSASPVRSCPDVEQALGAARACAGPDDVILVTGSFLTVANAMRALDAHAYRDAQC